MTETHAPRRQRPLRPLRRPLRPRDADGAARRADGGVRQAPDDATFQAELDHLLRDYVGRPTPLYFAENADPRQLGGAQIYLKREDLAHTGAHKINNALGQGLLAQRMGKTRIIAETGAGQHGVATATVCAMLGLECIVYMGAEDVRRQSLNVFRMKLLGAEVRARRQRQPHPQGRHQRGHPRLGDQRARHLLPDRQRRRARTRTR